MREAYTRRTILKAMTAAGMAGCLPATAYAQQAAGSMLRRPIPGTGEMLPAIGFGSTAAVRQIVQDGPVLLRQLLETMIDMGASVIDTAPRELEVDEAFGKVLMEPRFRDELFISTKIGLRRYLPESRVDKQGGMEQFEQTSRLFGRHPADLVQVESMTDLDLHWPTLRDLKARGETRYIGITSSATADHERMAAFMTSDRPDFIQVNYSLVEPGAGDRVLPLARDLGIGVLINSPFNGGEFFKVVDGHALPEWAAEFDCSSWAQFNLKYILGETAVNTALTETTRARHLVDNLQGGMGRLPDAGMRRRMKAHFDSLT